MSEYNARKYRSINMRLIDVIPANANAKVLNHCVQPRKDRRIARFKAGDSVRVSKFKIIFEKDYAKFDNGSLESPKCRKPL